MIDRGRLFDVPTYRWIPAKGRITVEYWIIVRTTRHDPRVARASLGRRVVIPDRRMWQDDPRGAL